MATALMATYQAFRDAGASEEKASAAAEELAAHENRFAKIEADVGLLKWMAGVNTALSMAIVGILLRYLVH